jgi:ketol-acid reductoisomerase
MACRGSGQVISNLGGTAKSIACPWCEGSGLRRAGIDAQASFRERQSAADDA